MQCLNHGSCQYYWKRWSRHRKVVRGCTHHLCQLRVRFSNISLFSVALIFKSATLTSLNRSPVNSGSLATDVIRLAEVVSKVEESTVWISTVRTPWPKMKSIKSTQRQWELSISSLFDLNTSIICCRQQDRLYVCCLFDGIFSDSVSISIIADSLRFGTTFLLATIRNSDRANFQSSNFIHTGSRNSNDETRD